ncbi:hypothetical protein [Streptomyces sp. NPDC057336]|uniref:hypothetical protein n=1 Tax=Streptomyces sp. NPDC057336 TaxID=3346102 RepID=UPI003630EF63
MHTSASSLGWCGWDDPLAYRTQDIVAVTAVPGLTASRFRSMTAPAPDAVIFRTYGAGEGPSEEQGLFEAVRELVASGTPVVVVSQSPQARIEMTKCAAEEVLHLASAVGAEDMTFEAVHAKLTFLLSREVPPFELGRGSLALWLSTLAGEITAPVPVRRRVG